MRDFVIALQFLTRITVNPNLELTSEDMARSTRMYPLVGLLIGGILAVLYWAMTSLRAFNGFTVASLIVVAEVLLTGGLHLDGLMDSADGLFSYRPRERLLEIMKDSRVGANGALALVCLVVLKIGLISSLRSNQVWLLVVMPVLARWAIVELAMSQSHASGKASLGTSVVGQVRRRELLFASGGCVILCVALALLAHFHAWPFSTLLLAVLGVVWLLVWLVARYIANQAVRKIGGITGDILGAVVEIGELVVLISGLVFARLLELI